MKKKKDILILDAEGIILNPISGLKKFLDDIGFLVFAISIVLVASSGGVLLRLKD